MASEFDIPDATGLVIAARAGSSWSDTWYSESVNTGKDSTGLYGFKTTVHNHYMENGQWYSTRRYATSHQSVGFWHHRMSKVRAHGLLVWTRTVFVFMCFVAGVMSLYWSVLLRADQNMRSLSVQVVDFDGQIAPYNNVQPLVGPMVTRLAQQRLDMSDQPSLGYAIMQPSQFNFDPLAVRQAVYNFDSYAAIIVNPNATALLMEAVSSGHKNYDPTGAIQMILVSAREETTYYNYIIPDLEAFSKILLAEFGPMWAESLMQDDSITKEMLAEAPSAVNPGISPLMIDLRPFQPATATPSVTIGLIYLIMMAFFPFSSFLPIQQKYITPLGQPNLHFWQFILWRWIVTVMSYFFVSLAYSLVSLAFQIPFWMPPASTVDVAFNATAFGRASFVVYWMVNFIGMIALGIACENMSMILGQPWMILWLIFWVVTNVATAFYPIDLAPGFFHWGYAWPLHNIVEASRTIIFDLHSRIGLNFGILFAWVAVNTALFPLCCYFQRWKMEHDRRVAEKEQDRYLHTREGGKEVSKQDAKKAPKGKRDFMRCI